MILPFYLETKSATSRLSRLQSASNVFKETLILLAPYDSVKVTVTADSYLLFVLIGLLRGKRSGGAHAALYLWRVHTAYFRVKQ